MPLDKRHRQLIEQKLANMDSYIEELAPYLEGSFEMYSQVPGRRRIVERLAQIIIESAIDTNNLLLVARGVCPAPTARASFETLYQQGVIDEYLLERFRQTYVGLRNRIVHDYDVLDNRIVFYTALRLLDDAWAYLAAIQRYLSSAQDELTALG